ncbi:MAG: SMR family transporter [Bacteroidota bacterium]
MSPWAYLIGASIMEIFWMLSLKYLDMGAIKNVSWRSFWDDQAGFIAILPLIGYILFGLTNVYLMSLAMKHMPMSIAFGVWFGIALVGSTLIDVLWFESKLTAQSYIFMALIIAGVIGLKVSTDGANL